MKESEYITEQWFAPKDTLECGQVFRFRRQEQGYLVLSQNKAAHILPAQDGYSVVSDDAAYFRNYFDFSRDYGEITTRLTHNAVCGGLLENAIAGGKGIRILRQNPFEATVSFLISQNNHIPRIKAIIERLCERLGEPFDFEGERFFAFPELSALAGENESFYREAGLGYRAEYLVRVCKQLQNEISLEEVGKSDTESARAQLMKLTGVGQKVADCILLFGFHKTDVFPVDTWMQKVYVDEFCQPKRQAKQITDYFLGLFGEDSGYAQQYLFYYKRSLKNE